MQRYIPEEHSVQLLGCVNLEISKNKFHKIDQSLQFLYYHINIKQTLWNKEYTERNKCKPKNLFKINCCDGGDDDDNNSNNDDDELLGSIMHS